MLPLLDDGCHVPTRGLDNEGTPLTPRKQRPALRIRFRGRSAICSTARKNRKSTIEIKNIIKCVVLVTHKNIPLVHIRQICSRHLYSLTATIIALGEGKNKL
jgi:hypothetical protein